MASRGPVPGMGQVMVLSKYCSGSYVSRTLRYVLADCIRLRRDISTHRYG